MEKEAKSMEKEAKSPPRLEWREPSPGSSDTPPTSLESGASYTTCQKRKRRDNNDEDDPDFDPKAEAESNKHPRLEEHDDGVCYLLQVEAMCLYLMLRRN